MRFSAFGVVLAALLMLGGAVEAQDASGAMVPRMIGKERAPVVIDEYISLGCPHCADFYLKTLPELEKRYVQTGKVRIVTHDYPLDGVSLKAAVLARCMPPDMYFPFIQVLYENQTKWALAPNPDKVLTQYARLGGLDEGSAQQCLNNQNLQNAVVAERETAEQMYSVQSTPTFIFNNGAEKMEGASDISGFATLIDRMLANKK
jgi:protein-disulfide isomerase